jgi:NitT/TauT family transport system ATP-binding protein
MTISSELQKAEFTSTNEPLIRIRNVSKSFSPRSGGEPVEALRHIALDVAERSFTTIVGPSGCGKTTLLRLMNGLIPPDTGEIRVGGRTPSPGPAIGFVFQSFRLLPWRTVRSNVGFSLEVNRVPPAERRERTDRILAAVGLSRFAESYPAELSGGMKQRVALARALVGEPGILLMDEPFASLDAQTRELMQAELVRIWHERPCAVVFVTHSVDEALLLGSQVVLMAARPGRIAEVISVNLPYPRTGDSMRSTPRFAELRDHLWGQIRAMVLSDPESDFFGRAL